jgi:hypothetical protein
MSLVAVLNESIPHMYVHVNPDHDNPVISCMRFSIAAVLTHLSATAWGGFQIYSTNSFHNDFKRVTTEGGCKVNLLPSYWTARGHAEISSLAFNITALLASCFLSFRLIKVKISQNRFQRRASKFTWVFSCSDGKPSNVWVPRGQSTGFTSLS